MTDMGERNGVLSWYRLPGAWFRCYPRRRSIFRNIPAGLECRRSVPPGPGGGGTMSANSRPRMTPGLPIFRTHEPPTRNNPRTHKPRTRNILMGKNRPFVRELSRFDSHVPDKETRTPLLFHGLLCVSSSRGGHANLLCIDPILRMFPEGNVALSQP